MTITLAKTETKLLIEATARGGTLQISDSMNPVTRDRLLGKLEVEGLIMAGGQDGAEPQLSPAGYRAVGLRAPRRKGAAKANLSKQQDTEGSAATESRKTGAAPRADTKRALLAEMLGRPDGASLAELMTVTGWLPHTTRAALSRIRSAGQPLAKATRDGVTVYRLVPEPPAPARRTRKPRPEAASAAAA